VYAAWDPDLDRKVALKLLHGERADQGQRLLREAQAMARLSHPNVITVHDVGEFDGRVFVAMEFVEGRTLKAWLRAETRTWQAVLPVFLRAGRGLAAAHERGLIHRDFKPDNVMIGNDGRVRVMDFGLVRSVGEVEPSSTRPSEPPTEPSTLEQSRSGESRLLQTHNSVLDSQLTVEGALLGTPAYMAPEQLRGDQADARSDQFAFCVALWEALYGERPFAGDNPLAVLFSVSQGQLREPAGARGVPSWLRRMLERGLAADPARRWPGMSELLARLGKDPRKRRRRWLLGLASLGSMVLVLAAALALQPELPPPPPPPCHGVETPVREVWTSERAQTLGERFAASKLVYAEDSRTRVVAGLDAWAAAWSTQRRDACEATELRREQSAELLDLRMACLDQRLVSFTALVELLVEADATVVEKSIEAVEHLPPLEPCSDHAWLLARVRPPEDPELAAKVDALRQQFAHVDALVVAGKSTDALEPAEAADREAISLEFPATIAEAALTRGRVEQELGRFAEAQGSYERAYFAAQRVGDGEVAVSSAYMGAYVLSLGLGDHASANMWLRHAEAEADHLGRDELRAEVWAVVGIRHYLLDEMDQAAHAFAQQVELHARTDKHPAVLGAAYINYGTVLARLEAHKADEVIEILERGMQLLVAGYGPDHPQVGLAAANYATAIAGLDRQPEAIVRYEQALRVLEQAYGNDHPMTALTQLNLGQSLIVEDQAERGLELLERSLATHELVYGPDHQMTAEALRGIGHAHIQLGQPAEAIAPLERAIAIFELSFDYTKDAAATSRHNLVRALFFLGRDDEAIAGLEFLERHYVGVRAHSGTPGNLIAAVRFLVGRREHIELARNLLHRARLAAMREGDLHMLDQIARVELELESDL
jgi:tetratricopeptide (TPR) repeat protein